jgi:hypothetical protein
MSSKVSKQIWEHPVTEHPASINDKSTANNGEYRVRFPWKIRKLGIDEDSCVRVKKEDMDNGVQYIVAEKYELKPHEDIRNKPDDVYSVFEDGGKLEVKIDADWTDYFIRHDGEDLLKLEINEIEDNFRVYRNLEYRHRRNELEERGIYVMTGKRSFLSLVLNCIAFTGFAFLLRNGFGDDPDDQGNTGRENFGNDVDDQTTN